MEQAVSSKTINQGALCATPRLRHQPPLRRPNSSSHPLCGGCLTYRGQLLDVEISAESTTYSLREGAGMVIRHEGEVISLDRANPSAVRPTLKPLRRVG